MCTLDTSSGEKPRLGRNADTEKLQTGIVKVSFVVFSLVVSRWTPQFLPQAQVAKPTKTSCLQPRPSPTLKTCSSDGTLEEFVNSSPTNVQGHGCWENVEFTESENGSRDR